MIRSINTIKKLTKSTAIKWAIACAAAAAFVPTASAQTRDYRGNNGHNNYHDNRDYHNDHHDHDDVHFGIGFGAAPAVAYQTQRVWVEPVYRTENDRIWVEPVYRTDCDRVWIEPVYEQRDVVSWSHGRRIVARQNVLVCAGHFEDRQRQVLVSPGCFRTVERQVLVSAGCWEDRRVPVNVSRPAWSFNFGYFGH